MNQGKFAPHSNDHETGRPTVPAAANTYTLQTLLHSSERNSVYRATQHPEERSVILKMLKPMAQSPASIAQLEREFQLLSELTGDFLPKPLALTNIDGLATLVLEDSDAISLQALLTKRRPSLGEKIDLFIMLTTALAELHARGIIHKDVNPANIIVNEATGRLQLIDLGIAAKLTREQVAFAEVDTLEGTFLYLSPEQTGRTGHPLDERSDLYAMGATFYEILTGMPPFSGNDEMEIVHAHLARVAKRPDEIEATIPVAMADLVMKLLEKAPESRYRSALGVAHDLKLIRQSLDLPAASRQAFQLAQKDIPLRFSLPQRLYGRSLERDLMLGCLDHVESGGSAMVLIGGPSGSGKTSLILELASSLSRTRTAYAEGKFEELRRDIPYDAIIRALRSHVLAMQTESETRIAHWRHAILDAVSPNCQLLIDAIPELESILGAQPPILDLAPSAAKQRFQDAFFGFVRAATKDGRALVLFLDDLQWADFASLELLGQLVQDDTSGRLLVIGAYRSNEISSSHPLHAAINEWRQSGITPTTIELGPMTPESVAELCRDGLTLPIEKTRPLAALVHDKTKGNPFFVQQFLRTLYRDQSLYFDTSRGHWCMDLAKIQKASITDNVANLLSARLEHLAPETRAVLGCAALCGASFDLSTLARVASRTMVEVMRSLKPAIEEELLTPKGSAYRYAENLLAHPGEDEPSRSKFGSEVRYRFNHDRIQEACDLLTPPTEKLALQLRIGRILIEAQEHEKDDETTLGLHHLNAANALVKDRDERRRIAALNLAAAKRAQKATAWAIAANLYQHGIAYLAANCWHTTPELSRELHFGAGTCEMLLGHFDSAEDHFKLLLEHAASALETAEIQLQRCTLYVTLIKNHEAIAAGLAGLAALGVEVSPQVTLFDLIVHGLKTKFKIATWSRERILNLPDAVGAHHEIALRIFAELAHPSVLAQPFLAAKLVFMEFDYVLAHGHSRYSAPVFQQLATTLSTIMFHISFPIWSRRNILLMIELWRTLSEKWHDSEDHHRQEYSYLFACSHFLDDFRKSMHRFESVFARSVARSDRNYASYALMSHLDLSFDVGDNVSQLLQSTTKYIPYVEQTRHEPYRTSWKRFRTCFSILSSEPLENLRKFTHDIKPLEELETGQVTITYCADLMLKGMLHHLTGDHREAYHEFSRCHRADIYTHFLGSYKVAIFVVFFAMSIASLWPEARGLEKLKLWAQMTRMRILILIFAHLSRKNFWHHHQLVEAEWLRAKGASPKRFGPLYEKAITNAEAAQFTSIEALAAEGYGLGLMQHQKPQEALGALFMARRAYEHWGLRAKARSLENIHPGLQRFDDLPPETTKNPKTANEPTRAPLGTQQKSVQRNTSSRTIEHHKSAMLDTPTLIRAAQVLAGEIHLLELKKKLMHLVCENAGARRALLIWGAQDHGPLTDSFRVVACATSEAELAVDLTSQELTDELLSTAALNYVLRTKSHLIVGDVREDGLWRNHQALTRRNVRALLCMPILTGGALKGFLYLENDLTPQAFTEERVHLLSLLGGQIAISLENAMLYAKIEDSLAAEREARAQEQRMHEEYVASDRARQELVTSLEAAEAVQKSLLVVDPPSLAYELAHLYRPAERAGGDWLGCYVDEKRERVYLFLGAVSGHGISSALVAAAAAGAAASAVAQIVALQDPISLVASMHQFGEAMHEAVRRTGEPSGRIMRMAMVGVDLKSGEAHYLNAGHLQIFWISKAGCTPIWVEGRPLGVAEKPQFGEHAFQLARGDRLFLFSDGLLKNHDGAQQTIDLAQLTQLLHATTTPQDLIDALAPWVARFAADRGASDTSALAIRWLPDHQKKKAA